MVKVYFPEEGTSNILKGTLKIERKKNTKYNFRM